MQATIGNKWQLLFFIHSFLLLTALIMLSSCMGGVNGTAASPTKQYNTKPEATPAKTITGFSESLSCMDALFNKNGIETIFISSQDIQDKASPGGEFGNGGTDMLISAVSEIAASSGAIRYIGNRKSMPELAMLHDKHKDKKLNIPDYYIVGSISQLDERIERANKKRPSGKRSPSVEKAVSVLGLDLNVFEVKSNLLLPGITAKNTLAVTRDGAAGTIDGKIKQTGISFDITLDKNEGKDQAVRTLIELSVVELMGKLTGVPYRDCLGLETASSSELITASRKNWWMGLGYEERISKVQTLMQKTGHIKGGVTSVMDDETIRGIKSFQRHSNMVIDGKVSLDLFLKVKRVAGRRVSKSYRSQERLLEVRAQEQPGVVRWVMQ